MKKLTQGSFWLGIFEQLVYVVPTLATILYYYFTELEETISTSSKWSFAVACVLFVLLCVYRYFAKVKLQELRQSTIQTETDLENTPVSEVEKREILAENCKKKRLQLDTLDRAMIMLILLILGLAIYILEQATIGLTNLVMIALVSCAAGTGIHVGVLELKKNESLKVQKHKKK